MLNIPIVVVAYNRAEPLQRLLSSLDRANYPGEVELIISIDGSDVADKIAAMCERFTWRHGSKRVLVSKDNMGLRAHILKCGRLACDYDGIILLEDDLYVSRYFYTYLQQAQQAYMGDNDIAGVALYSHQYNETACLPFRPIEDGSDVYFMRLACSWGQSWLSDQWRAFDEWYSKNHMLDLATDPVIPPDVRLWPETSWKKYFLKYMIDEAKFFVYPRISLASNFADPGVHHAGTNILQVPLLCGDRDYNFPPLKQSMARYDAYCEILPECLVELSGDLSAYDFSVDLYAMKNRQDIATEYVLTTQDMKRPVASYGRKLKPQELNIVEDITGTGINLGLVKNMPDYGSFLSYRNRVNQDYINTHAYFYAVTKYHYKETIPQKHVSIYVRIFKKMARFIIDLVKR